MGVMTKAGKDAIDSLSATAEEIEEEVRERIEDAIRALQAYSPTGSDAPYEAMDAVRDGEYLSRDDVLAAVRRGAW